MSGWSSSAVERARALVGAPFRPQGRDPATGLDCVGLILCVFAIPPSEVSRDYRLSGNDQTDLERELRRFFRRTSVTRKEPGDVLLCRVRARQLHLAVDCGASFVHADARLRRVVERPGAPPWPTAGAYRRKIAKAGSN
jgi:cell wall-associated NlpC family hydrolase